MPIKTEKLPSSYMYDFKVGDNMVRNARTLCQLVEKNKDGVFNKLIVVQAGSLVEAALTQIVLRAKNHNREGVPNITEEDRKKIEDENSDTFFNVIKIMGDYHILDDLGANICAEDGDLHKLRLYRNRVHIQNDKKPKDVSRDEDAAFSDDVVTWALKLNVQIIKHLSEKYPRRAGLEQMVEEIEVPSP